MTRAQEVLSELVTYKGDGFCPVCDRKLVGRRFIADHEDWYCACGWWERVSSHDVAGLSVQFPP